MAQYKLIQDIEAEDKILGPLTLRQFIFGLIAAFLFYLCFISVIKHVPFLLVIMLPPALFCAFFAMPFGRDQPTEVWALAKLRFWFKPRKRVWNQSGIKEMVTITAPKKVERQLTNGLSPGEVDSRLKVLAQTLDSRGWAVKHASAATSVYSDGSDRLIGFDSLPQDVVNNDDVRAEDMLDESTNPIARQFDTMIDQASQVRRQELMGRLNGPAYTQASAAPAAAPALDSGSPWFMSQTPVTEPANPTPVPAAAASIDEGALSAQLANRANSRRVSLGNLRTMRPAAAQSPAMAATRSTAAQGVQTAVTASDDPAILSLARNDDLSVATLARAAKKNEPQGEVVITLH